MGTPARIGHSAIGRLDHSTEAGWLTYVCAYCDVRVSGVAFAAYRNSDGISTRWLLCPSCGVGSVWCDGDLYPSPAFGPAIEGLPPETAAAYKEARRCMSVGAYTAAELICRKILMHVAVEKDAEEGKTFASYISHLESQGYVTPPMKPWVTLIKDHGNQSTHELEAPDRNRAESTVMFTAELLRLVYEMTLMTNKYAKPPPAE